MKSEFSARMMKVYVNFYFGILKNGSSKEKNVEIQARNEKSS